SAITAVFLEDLYLVAVGVLDEEELGEQRPLAVKLLDRLRLQPLALEARVLGLDVVDREGDMPVAGAEVVGLALSVIDRQLDLEVGLGVPEINEREALELEAVGDLQPERGVVEVRGAG